MSTDQGSIFQCTPFTVEKLRWWFNLLDVNKDGSISEADFQLIASRYVQEYQLEEADTAELGDKLVNSWGTQKLEAVEEEVKHNIPLISKMADDLKAGLNIAQDDIIVAFEQLIEHNSQLARSTLENMVAAFFDVFDYNQDNYITKQEFVVAMRCFGLEEPEVAETVFVCMGGDQEGRLSRQEYVDSWLNFLLG
ncbi:unnamed protein product [Candidula unifasciata]|uniref:EF-hand domain-containing protein n=1 Tax=Candidula unifasciata TaxID=100452 RepID=A0A8S3ZRZ4_9EUPU|nr:unnamed protein product [Candidula unifasciata]